MWVWLDSAGPVLFDAALSTAIFLTLVVLAMLVCRQPTRRLLIARVAIIASLAMIPLVALVPLPRLDLLDTLLQTDLVAHFVDRRDRRDSDVHARFDRARARGSLALRASICTTGCWDRRWLPRSLTLIDLACVGTGIAWLMLGFWGVRWLIRHSRAPSAATAEIFDRLFDDDVHRRTPAGVARYIASSAPGRRGLLPPDDLDPARP